MILCITKKCHLELKVPLKLKVWCIEAKQILYKWCIWYEVRFNIPVVLICFVSASIPLGSGRGLWSVTMKMNPSLTKISMLMYVRHINSVLNKRGKNVNIEQGRGLIMDGEGTDGQRTAEHRQNNRKTLTCAWILFFLIWMRERLKLMRLWQKRKVLKEMDGIKMS